MTEYWEVLADLVDEYCIVLMSEWSAEPCNLPEIYKAVALLKKNVPDYRPPGKCRSKKCKVHGS